jgi:hypothetical protein
MLVLNETFDVFREGCDQFRPALKCECRLMRQTDESREVRYCCENDCPRVIHEKPDDPN